MARKRATLTDLFNDLTFNNIYNKFKMIALNQIEWVGLPECINPKHIERYLFNDGKAIFFIDPNMSYMCLKTSEGGNLNVYDEPLSWRAIGNGYNEEYPADQCVIIDNNPLRLATHDFLMMYAYKIAEAERTMDVNVKANKTPFIIACDDKDVLTFKAIFSKIDGNVPAIYADKGLSLDSIQVFKTGVTLLVNELTDYKNSVESELLTFLGVNNVNVDKKERLITDEAESNNELIQAFAQLQLVSRQLACEQINKMYGLNVSVRFRCSQPGTKPDPNDKDEGGDKDDV